MSENEQSDLYVRDKILLRVKRELDHHIFSDKSYPKSITITTEYNECTQSLRINFEDIIPKEKEGEKI